MGLSRDDFLTYCYVYALLIQRGMLPTEDKLGEQRVLKLLSGLWKRKNEIDERQPFPIHSAKAGYNQDRQALWIRRREIPGLTLIGKSSLSLVNEGRTFDTMLLRPFEDGSRLWARAQPPPFLPLGLLSENFLNHVRRSGMRIDGEKYAFQGAVIQGYENRVLWLGIRNDKETYAWLEIAASESHKTTEPTSLSFPARMRAAWIRHEDPASVEEYDSKHKLHTVPKEEKRPSTPVSISEDLPSRSVVSGPVLDEKRNSSPEEFRVAVDTTLLLAADSFLGCLRFEDPRARSAFWFVVTMYCGCEHLFLKKPPKEPDVMPPLLALFWEEASGSTRDVGSTLLKEATLMPTLVKPFERLVSQERTDLPLFVQHQLMDERMDTIYWTGGSPVESLKTGHQVLRDAGLFDHPNDLLSALRHHQREFRLYGEAEKQQRDFGGALNYALTYTFVVFARAPIYAIAHDESRAYESHWMRRYAALEPGGQAAQYQDLLNWGWILALLQPRLWPTRLSETEESVFRDRLSRLRRFTLRNKIRVRDYLGRKRDLVTLIANGLHEAGFIDAKEAIALLDEQYAAVEQHVVMATTAELVPGVGPMHEFTSLRSTVLQVAEAIATGKQLDIDLGPGALGTKK